MESTGWHGATLMDTVVQYLQSLGAPPVAHLFSRPSHACGSTADGLINTWCQQLNRVRDALGVQTALLQDSGTEGSLNA